MIITSEVLAEINSVVALTDRVKKAKEAYLASEPVVCPEYSRLVTESWQETEGEPIVIRRARAFQKVLESLPVTIRDGELIVGSQTKHIRGTYPISSFSPEEVIKALKTQKVTVSGDYVTGSIAEKDRKSILGDCQYWLDKAPSSIATRTYRNLWGSKVTDLMESKIMWEVHDNAPTGKTGDYGKVLTMGLSGIIAEARDELNKLGNFTFESKHKFDFLQSVIISCDAVIGYAHRYARLARTMARKEPNETRKQELKRVAEICEWVPANPARDFYEAAQSFWFTFLALILETGSTSGEAPGRFDQYMYPLYAKDIREGLLTRQAAAELLGCLLIKFLEQEAFKSEMFKKANQGSQFFNLTIGGQTPDGDDATNELSFLFLEAARQIKARQPHISLRYHDKICPEFMLKAAETNRDIGAGIPAFFNDKASVLALTQKGIPIAEARNWVPQGCVERTIYPSSCLYHGAHFFNLPKCLELALNNGLDPRTGKRLGPATGDARRFGSFEEVYKAFEEQVASLTSSLAQILNVWLVVRAENYALPFNSALLTDCIQNGTDSVAGGARWNKKLFAGMRPVGHVNVANSLAAIKKLVFDEKRISMSGLLDALAVNFEGKEDVQGMLLKAPKYGNDDDYVDGIMKDLFSMTAHLIKQHKNVWGEPFYVSRQSVTTHYPFGRVVGASPEGRKAGEPLADGSVSPMRGTDTKGPTAVIKSASKMDNITCEATLLNQKLTPASLHGRTGLMKFISLIKTYFDLEGHHIQFNILDQSTLLDAKKHPEKYRDLLVRVAGFSAYFVELAPEVQDEIIARAQHTL